MQKLLLTCFCSPLPTANLYICDNIFFVQEDINNENQNLQKVLNDEALET